MAVRVRGMGVKNATSAVQYNPSRGEGWYIHTRKYMGCSVYADVSVSSMVHCYVPWKGLT